MSRRLFYVLIICASQRLFGQEPLANLLVPFEPGAAKIESQLSRQPTNALNVYLVAPRNFGATTVSNLLAVAGLSDADRDAHSGTSDTNALRYTSRQRKFNWLLLRPNRGVVILKTQAKRKDGEEGDLVPSVPEIIALGSNFLTSVMGIQTNELAYRAPGELKVLCSLGTHESNRPGTKERVKAVTDRGVDFFRAVDGCLVVGGGGVASFEFEDYGKLLTFQLTWRQLEFARSLPRPPLNYFKEAVSTGRAMYSGKPIGTPKRITLDGLDYCYEEKPDSDNQATLQPIARITATIYDAKTNMPVLLFCSLPTAESPRHPSD
ncbi:MAG: hypothetical protein EXS35_10285 [Pedosphaera sp.]|nr:hypothetical protein [Pedosphaera sp.]